MNSLRGQLLISGPALYDLNFRHTVVLIGEHTEHGAVGVILNRATELSVFHGVPPLAELVPEGEVVFEGGPVEPQAPVVVAEFTDPGLADILVFGDVGFITGDVPREVRAGIRRARVFAGHAGWGAGQLEREMSENSWILDPAQVDDVFTDRPVDLWQRVLQRKGPDFQQIARIPFDPRMN